MALLAGHGGEGGPTLQGTTLGRALPIWLSLSPEGPTPIKYTTSVWQSARGLIPLPCLFLKKKKKKCGAQHCGTKSWPRRVNVCWIGSGECKGHYLPSRPEVSVTFQQKTWHFKKLFACNCVRFDTELMSRWACFFIYIYIISEQIHRKDSFSLHFERTFAVFFFFSEVQIVQIVDYVHVKGNTMQSCITNMLIFKLIEFFPEYPWILISVGGMTHIGV